MAALARKTVEVYEVHSRSSVMHKWKGAQQGYASKDGHGCENRDVLTAAPGYVWDGGWQLDVTNIDGASGVGETDSNGWDYATDKTRFGPGQGAHRIPRGPGMKDTWRRRRWYRFVTPAPQAGGGSKKGAAVGLVKHGAQTPESKLAMVRTLMDGLSKAQREVEKIGQRLGTKDDSENLRSTVRDYLGKVRLAQQEVGRQVDGLGDDTASQQGRRHLSKITGPYAQVEDDLARKLQQPLPAPGQAATTGRGSTGGGPVSRRGAGDMGGGVSGGGPGVSGGNGRFVPGADAGGGGGEGAYVSRQQQEQALESRLRAIGNEEMDAAIMQEREVQITQVADNVLVLNELFKDMANLVHEQQEQIDLVETNVDSAALRTQQGVVHLERAIEHQKACVIS